MTREWLRSGAFGMGPGQGRQRLGPGAGRFPSLSGRPTGGRGARGAKQGDGGQLEGDVERLGPDGAHFLHGEAEHVPLGIYLLHDLVVRGLAEITGALVEEHLEVVALDVIPNSHPVSGHNLDPLLTLSVRYAVRTNASPWFILITTHKYLSPTTVIR